MFKVIFTYTVGEGESDYIVLAARTLAEAWIEAAGMAAEHVPMVTNIRMIVR